MNDVVEFDAIELVELLVNFVEQQIGFRDETVDEKKNVNAIVIGAALEKLLGKKEREQLNVPSEMIDFDLVQFSFDDLPVRFRFDDLRFEVTRLRGAGEFQLFVVLLHLLACLIVLKLRPRRRSRHEDRWMMNAHLHGFHGLAKLENGSFVIADGVLELFHVTFFLQEEMCETQTNGRETHLANLIF